MTATTGAAYGSTADRLAKEEATCTALLAQHGHSLHRLSDGSYLVSKWTGVRPCADLAAVRQFLKLLGVPA